MPAGGEGGSVGLKILHSADWHLDSPFASLSPEDREYLRRESRRIPGQIASVCRREGCNVMLLAGDLFDGKYTRESVTEVAEALKYAGVPVFISPGNHDFVSPESPWIRERWPDNVHIFTGGMEYVDVPELELRVWGAGYRSMDCPPLLDGFHAQPGPKYQVGVLHGDPMSAASPYCPVTAAQVKGSGLQYLALGHIHRADGFRAGDTLCAWPGCPMGRGWDETGEKGVLLVTLNDDAAVRPVKLELPCFYSFETPVGEDPAAALESCLPPAGEGNFYRVTLTGRGKADRDALAERFSRYARLELVDRTRPPVDLAALSGEDTLRGVYFKKLLELTEDPECAFAARLAGEISLDILDGREVVLP